MNKDRETNSTKDKTSFVQGEPENYIYLVTLKPNFKSYIKRSINDSSFMSAIFEVFMRHFCQDFKLIDANTEYDSKGVCHIHSVLASKMRITNLYPNKSISINTIINFKRGIYVDFKMIPLNDLEKVIRYINKSDKNDSICQYYETSYGFI